MLKNLMGLSLIASLCGCGTYVPELQEFPGGQVESQQLVRAITRSVQCEMRNAIAYVIDQDIRVGKLNGARSAAWFDKWGVQVALTLTVSEKTSANPSVTWTPGAAAPLLSLGATATASAEATRIDTLGYYFTVMELYRLHACPATEKPGVAYGSLLIQSDLKLREMLEADLFAAGTGDTRVPTSADTILKQDAISHEVKFEVITEAGVNPVFMLRRVVINDGSQLLSGNRDRTHDLLMTFGPIDSSNHSLTNVGASTFTASQIGVYINNSLGRR